MRDIDQALRLDKDATKIALGYYEGLEDVALINAVAPQINVIGNGKYPTYAVGAWWDADEDEIGPGATQVTEYIPPTEEWIPYVITMHARKVRISSGEADSSGIAKGMVYSDRKVAAKRLTDVLFQKYVKVVADLMIATGNSAAPGTAWDAPGATPFDDIQTWYTALKDLIGVGGYTALLTDRIMSHLGEGCRAKYAHTGNMSNYDIVSKNVTRDIGIEKLLVSNKAEYYTSGAFTSVWGKNFFLFKNKPNIADFDVTHMATMVPTKKQFIQVLRPYGQETLDFLGDWTQVRMWYLVKELDTNAVYKGSSVIS